MNIIILGPQGSGKGTQAEKLAEKFNLEHIEMGKFLRDVARGGTELGKQIHEIINIQGKLVDDKTLKKVLHVKLASIPREQGIIFDGVPRDKDQLAYFEDAMKEFGREIEAVIDIEIPEKEAVKRIAKRWICKKNQHSLIMGKDVKKPKDKCPIDGSGIFQRIDDTPERIKVRLGIYHENTKDVIDFYQKQGKLISIDGCPKIEKVHEEILKKLKTIISKK